MPLNGDVKTFPLSAIVQMIHDEGKTGLLTVSDPRRRCRIYFRGGKIIFVSGNTDKELRLGALLKANNLISEDRLEDMLAVAKAMEKRLGTVLLERNYIDADKLTSILNLQFKEVVTTTLSWDEARFTFTDGLDGLDEDVSCEVDPVRLVAEARKRGEFKGIIPNDQVVFQINPSVDTSKSIHAARDLRVLLLVDGRRSVAHIIKETGYSRLAMYRSLAKLHAENAIVRKGAERQPPKVEGPGPQIIVGLYTSMLQLMLSDLTEELGSNKAAASLENSLKRSSYYERFLKGFRVDQNLATNTAGIQAVVEQQGQALTQQEFISGFNQVVAGLLAEQYQFLGYKGTTNTVKRVRAALENAPANQRLLARAISRSLEQYENEDFLRGGKTVAPTVAVGDSGTAGVDLHPIEMGKMSGSAIVNFYNDMFQIVLTDMDNVVGAKAQGLFQNLIRGSKYSDTLVSKFDLGGASGTNPLRLKENINTKELKITKQDLIQTFQQVLGGLLLEESLLLGPKAAGLTVSRLVERMTAGHAHFKPLLDQLTASMASKSAKTGG
jgi:hypothetical protein